MECSSGAISCALNDIAAAIDASGSSSFIQTLLATLVGALVAGGISIGLYRHEISQRRRSEIDVAVSELIREIQLYSQAYEAFLRYLQNWSQAESHRIMTGGPATGMSHPGMPAREGIDTAVEMLVVLTSGDDRKIAERARQVLYELTFLKDFDKQRAEYSAVRRVLVAWRAQKRTTHETLANLDVIDRRREIIEGDLSNQLPPLPEPYVRRTRV